jgi:transaldolase
MAKYKSTLHEMTCTTPTVLWNDSCSVAELNYAIEHGAVGATANPVIIGTVLKQEMHLWKERIPQLIAEMPEANEDEVAWALMEEISRKGAELLMPAFEKHNGRNGRLSIQTDPRNYRNTDRIVAQAVHFSHMAPNIVVKIPVTVAGVAAIEEATYRGVSINATVSFCVPQALAVAEAVERGLSRREAEGKDISTMGPVCTIMVGRLDDWLRVLMERDGIITDPGYTQWAGVAAMKRAYQIYRERGYRLRLLSAAMRNHMHWSEFIGGDVVISPPHSWQVRYNASDVTAEPRMDRPVDPHIVNELMAKFSEFRRSYEPDGMTIEAFDTYGPTVRTLRGFIDGYHEFCAMVRNFMLPNPDVR